MILKSVEIHKYKSIKSDQKFELEKDVTVLVGMNESGKTSILEAIAKTNYFQDDEDFKFNTTHDFPRSEKKAMEKSGENAKAISSTFLLDEDLVSEIEADVGEGVVQSSEYTVTTMYEGKNINSIIKLDIDAFFKSKFAEFEIIDTALQNKIKIINTYHDLQSLIEEQDDELISSSLSSFEKYFENPWKWDSPLSEYVTRVYLKPNQPKFLYYDEYFALPSRISIEALEANELEENEDKTAKALFELADINTSEIIAADDFENYIAELEATEAIISEELFKYWNSNNNLNVRFHIDKRSQRNGHNHTIVEHILDIRVQSKGVSLPLKNRSKGFNWFFSFLVWFKKIQEDKDSNYVLLLDEPGLNLHASAQADLLRFIEDLAADYQIVYTTHSPFMVTADKLNRVRTVLETDNGSIISDSIQQKDPNTLFPLQAALGYDIAQNLFISNKNLLVEGVSDLIILTAMSGLLESEKRECLSDEITIVPTGGLDKVASFISLLRGSSLQVSCLLDSFVDQKSEAKLNKMVQAKIIKESKINFFHDFIDGLQKADIEDLFEKSEYIILFNYAFTEHTDIKETDLDKSSEQIIMQINKHLGIKRYNHYRPANELVKQKLPKNFFSKSTLDRFEAMFKIINKNYQ